MKQELFTCSISGYYIEYVITDTYDIAYMNTVNCDFIKIKAFIQLLRTSIEKLKKINVKKIRQTVSADEWFRDINDKTTFQLVNIDNKIGLCDIECDIDDFLENFGRILNVNGI